MSRWPPLKALLAFRHAAEALSFKEAAERLNVTQAAVSQQIKTLEQHLGLALFERRTREVALTPAGQRLLPAVRRGFRALEEGLAALQEDPRPSQLTLSVLPSFASRWLVPRLGGFQQQSPELAIRLSPSTALTSFEEEDVDLAVRFGQGRYPGLVARPLLKEYLVPVCHPSLVRPERPIVEQLTGWPLLADDGPDMASAWGELQRALGVTLAQGTTRLSVTDATLLVEAVLSGQGFAMLRYSLAYELLERGSLICPLPLYQKSPYDYYLVAPDSHFRRPKVRLFVDWLCREVQVVEASWRRFEAELSKRAPEN